MENKYPRIKTVALCLCTAALFVANTKVYTHATGAGIQLGTDLSEEVAPVPAPEENAETAEPAEQIVENANPEAVSNVENAPIDATENAAQNTTQDTTQNTAENTPEDVPVSEEVETVVQAESELDVDSRVAYIEVAEYNIAGGLLEAGNDLTINLTIHNISSVESAESVVLTMSSESSRIFPQYGTDNQIFIGKMLPDESKTISIPISVSSKLDGDAADFICKFDYISADKKLSNSSTMIITTSSGNSLVVKSIDLSAHAILNGKSLLNINYANKTNGNITDAELIIDGNVSPDSKMIRLDTAYAGKSYSKDYNVTFTKAGNQVVKVKLVYTDVNGERKQTDLGSYSVSVSPEVTTHRTDNSSRALLWGGRAIAAIMAFVALSVCLSYYKKR